MGPSSLLTIFFPRSRQVRQKFSLTDGVVDRQLVMGQEAKPANSPSLPATRASALPRDPAAGSQPQHPAGTQPHLCISHSRLGRFSLRKCFNSGSEALGSKLAKAL